MSGTLTTNTVVFEGVELDLDRMPRHVGIIMDGNFRWAKRRKLDRFLGHKAGLEALKRVLTANRTLKIPILSVYAFSTENWSRSEDEISGLMTLFEMFFEREFENILRENLRIIHSGDADMFSDRIRNIIRTMVERSTHCDGGILNLAINYSGRQEIAIAAQKIAADVRAGLLEPSAVTEEEIGRRLFNPEIPDMDLLIRTSGEFRISNFMLWRAAYTEFYLTDVHWPDFSGRDLALAAAAYQSRERRFGGRKDNFQPS